MSKWTMSEDGRHLYDEDFNFDVRLDVDGDFAEEHQRIAYTKALLAKITDDARVERFPPPCYLAAEDAVINLGGVYESENATPWIKSVVGRVIDDLHKAMKADDASNVARPQNGESNAPPVVGANGDRTHGHERQSTAGQGSGSDRASLRDELRASGAQCGARAASDEADRSEVNEAGRGNSAPVPRREITEAFLFGMETALADSAPVGACPGETPRTDKHLGYAPDRYKAAPEYQGIANLARQLERELAHMTTLADSWKESYVTRDEPPKRLMQPRCGHCLRVVESADTRPRCQFCESVLVEQPKVEEQRSSVTIIIDHEPRQWARETITGREVKGHTYGPIEHGVWIDGGGHSDLDRPLGDEEAVPVTDRMRFFTGPRQTTQGSVSGERKQ